MQRNPSRSAAKNILSRSIRCLATAKLNGLDPLRWLSETLEKLPTCPNRQLDSLLPFAHAT
jgi:hypothetical protein